MFKDTFDSPDLLAERIGEALECPITIEDSKHGIISYSKHKQDIDEVRIATIMSRKVPDNIINSLWKSGVMTELFESDEPVIVPAIKEVGLGNRVAVSIRKNNKILGFIWAHTSDSFLDEEKLYILKKSAQIVKNQLLQKRIKKVKEEENHQEFFWRLLTGQLNEKEVIVEQAKEYGIELYGRQAITVLEFDLEISETVEKHINYLLETLHRIHVVCRLIDQNQLILLIRLNDNNDSTMILNQFLKHFIQKLRLRLPTANVRGSSGAIYMNPEYIKDSYHQALKVLTLKDKFPKELQLISSYQELGIYQFIDELQKKQTRENYQNRSIEKLKHYDQQNNTELLETLKVYLEFDSNVREAASSIHVHTNTLNYRIKRIIDITGIDLKDTNQKVCLYLDLQLEKLKKKSL
ncbi:PucR family transcriptional regulator [Oceanobacillus sp. 143]|uniref:PucR family transcriptional regulator n=2 Tax=Oceanobacillus zhaokaii TaxID=2052660 RepID=A0A345PMJ5_9BACI|nr:hypothetical protein CUC15_18790 [Oceanobacillus zhaokaii]QGS69982.1 PucR family transcriptional regulator [Oceanobacillus sp. 143]